MFNFEHSSSKLYGKTQIPGEDIENFVSALTRLGYDTLPPPPQPQAQSADHQNESNENKTNTTSTTLIKNEHDYSNQTEPKKSKQPKAKTHSDSDSYDSEGSMNDEKNGSSDEASDTDNNDEDDDEENDDDDDDEEEDSSNSDGDDEFKLSKRKSRLKSDDSAKRSADKSKQSGELKNKKANLKKSLKLNNAKLKQSNKLNSKKKTSNKNCSTNGKQPKQRRQRNSSSVNQNDLELEQDQAKRELIKKAPEQCLGPECIRPAVQNSKYCSFECGMRLAKDRLVYYLKTRYEQYSQSEPLSNKLNLTELERINSEIDVLKCKLNELEQKHLDLDKLIERAKFEKINPNVEVS